MITFEPLYNYLNEHEITKYQLLNKGVISPVHITRLSTHHNFNLKFIEKLCKELNCQPGDIIKYIPDDTQIH